MKRSKITKKKVPKNHHPTTHNIKKIKKSLHTKSIKTIKKSSTMHKAKNIPKRHIKKILIKNAKKNINKNNPNKKTAKHVVKISAKKVKNNVVNNISNNNIDIKTPEVLSEPKSPKRVIIVHGWDGDINKGWFPWIKKELETQGFKVIMERMPNPGRPQIDEWIGMLKSLSGNIDERTYFIGHSIGCQTIMRMLEKIESEKIGGAVFLAGWFDLTEHTYKENPKMEKEMRKIAEPWISTRFDLYKVKSKFIPGTVTAIFSEDDPYVDLKNAEAFKQWLDARIIIENGKGHFEEAKISQMPLLIEEILRISKESDETK